MKRLEIPAGHKRVGLEDSHAVAHAVMQCNVDVVAAYPITPQTHIVERLAEMVANGELDAEFVPVESEHSAMSVCVGASAAGARTFTCTSAQGLILMSEIVYIASAMRLPVVMVLANRSLSGPLSIWCDHTDLMCIRDCGWIQTVADTGQELYDSIFHAYKVAEKTLHPVIVNADGFYLTHVVEPILVMEQALVERYLPPFQPRYVLDPRRPVTMGAYGVPELYMETKKNQDEALKATYPTIIEEWQEFGRLTGRFYNPVEVYPNEECDIYFLSMGTIGMTCMVAVQRLREKGANVGVARLKLFRPFPFGELRKKLRNAKKIIVMDRALSYGGPGGPLASEIRACFYEAPNRPAIYNYVVGLAGRDVTVEDFEKVFDDVQARKEAPRQEEYVIYGVRE